MIHGAFLFRQRGEASAVSTVCCRAGTGVAELKCSIAPTDSRRLANLSRLGWLLFDEPPTALQHWACAVLAVASASARKQYDPGASDTEIKIGPTTLPPQQAKGAAE